MCTLLNVGTVIRIVAQHLLVHLQALEDAVRVTRGAWNMIQFRVAIESSPLMRYAQWEERTRLTFNIRKYVTKASTD
jgi:hypothetical protein